MYTTGALAYIVHKKPLIPLTSIMVLPYAKPIGPGQRCVLGSGAVVREDMPLG
jgi:hypothetical protein